MPMTSSRGDHATLHTRYSPARRLDLGTAPRDAENCEAPELSPRQERAATVRSDGADRSGVTAVALRRRRAASKDSSSRLRFAAAAMSAALAAWRSISDASWYAWNLRSRM